MLNYLKHLLGREYRYLNNIELSRANLFKNYQYLSSLDPNFKIAPVLKSNAYGHGITQIAEMIESLNPPFICVDSLHEAYDIYKTKVKTPILIMGYINPENLRFKKLPFSYAVYDLNYLKEILRYQPNASIHLKVDTGMHRMGIPLNELEQFLIDISDIKGLKIEGLMSHFASASDNKDPLFNLQVENFQKAKQYLSKYHHNLKWFHIGATEAIINPTTRKEILKVTNLGRAGKALYGYALNSDDPNLKPILTLNTTIAQIKNLKKGDTVGYDGTYKVKDDLTMAILPIGYFDGVDRRLSNIGVVKINGIFCPIIGRVSMNITTVDITKVKDPKVGQIVEVISDNPQDENSILNIAKTCDTIPHEILVHLDSSINRVMVQ